MSLLPLYCALDLIMYAWQVNLFVMPQRFCSCRPVYGRLQAFNNFRWCCFVCNVPYADLRLSYMQVNVLILLHLNFQSLNSVSNLTWCHAE